jgi:hypothetical protein
VLVPCIESNIKIVFEQAMSTVDLKNGNTITSKTVVKRCFSGRSFRLDEALLLLKGDDI